MIKQYISLYPNPVQDVLMIEGLKSGSLIRIVDVSGSIVGNYKAEGDIVRIPFDNFMSGVYFIQIQYDGKVKTEKILKK